VTSQICVWNSLVFSYLVSMSGVVCVVGVLAASSFASITGGSGGPYPARARAAVTAPGMAWSVLEPV